MELRITGIWEGGDGVMD